MKNLVIYTWQSTLDTLIRVGAEKLTEKVGSIAEETPDTIKIKTRSGKLRPIKEVLREIAHSGLDRDHNLRLDEDNSECADWLRKLLSQLDEFPKVNRIGGNPAISALRIARLAGHSEGPIPWAAYVGLMSTSVHEYIEQADSTPELRRVFDPHHSIRVNEYPTTIALESERHKLILAYGPGRSPTLLRDANQGFSPLIDKLRARIGGIPGRAVLGMNAPRPLEVGEQLINELRSELPELALFVATSSLRHGNELDTKNVREIAEGILRHAQILSFNEQELHDVHTAVVGNGGFRDISLARKLQELPFEAITVVHSAFGAMMKLGTDPETIINSTSFSGDPSGFLAGCLQRAVDGAAYAIDSVANVGRTANEAMVRVYSESIRHRCEEQFAAVMLNTIERLPGGIIAAQSPLVAKPLSALTGVGAIFDGLLLANLMRD